MRYLILWPAGTLQQSGIHCQMICAIHASLSTIEIFSDSSGGFWYNEYDCATWQSETTRQWSLCTVYTLLDVMMYTFAVGDNWIKICNLAYIVIYNRCVKNRFKIINRLWKMSQNHRPHFLTYTVYENWRLKSFIISKQWSLMTKKSERERVVCIFCGPSMPSPIYEWVSEGI